MAKRDMIDDLVDIIHPRPDPLPDDADDNTRDGHWLWCNEVEDQRRAFEQRVRSTEENTDSYYDPLLAEISTARREMLDAEQRMRLLIAYGREFPRPGPYQLKDLAAATGMSISGTRGAYTDEEITTVAQRIGRQPRSRTEATGSAS